MRSPEPVLKPVAIKDLRPTQITVGYREVAAKRKEWRARSTDDGGSFLGHHMVPVVIGPKGRHYVIDHHHLARALEDEGVKDMLVNVAADLQVLDKSAFWVYLDNRGWCHTYDAEGQRQDFEAMPSAIADLADDPYRSLAGELRLAGGYAKDNTPFSEFIWADFLRRRIKRKLVEKDFETALQEALGLAKGGEANYLPGWCGATATA
jgi:hypothetical protein